MQRDVGECSVGICGQTRMKAHFAQSMLLFGIVYIAILLKDQWSRMEIQFFNKKEPYKMVHHQT